LVFGHRGYSSRAPENTLAAFRMLLQEGVPGVELDVQLCGSGEVVVIHDYGLRRVTGLKAPVAETSYADIRRLDAGSWFAPKYRNERIPLLSEVFDLLGTSVYYDIEIKHRGDTETDLEEKLAALINEYGLVGSVMVSSFEPRAATRVKTLLPSVPTGVIFASPKKVRHILPGLGHGARVSYDVLKPYYRRVKPGYLLMQRGLYAYSVVAWTVNSVRAARKLASMGVDGFISDDPGPIHRAVRSVETGPGAHV
jgi:glycerophosphoryl diester phosphodiesterase